MQPQDECKARCEEVERALEAAEQEWRAFGERLERAEEALFESRLESLRRWFALEEAELGNWAEGGLRHSARARVQGLLVMPLVEKMHQRVGFSRPAGDAESPAATRTANQVLDELFDYWESRAKPVYTEAWASDEKLAKKIRKTEKDERAQGVMALNMQDTKKVAALKRQRPSIWEASQKVLEKCVGPVKRLGAFFQEDLPPRVVAQLAAAVPVVACRAVCDWYFQRCLVDSDQLEKWWSNTKATLQKREALWGRLLEQEGLLLRRIEGGIEDLGTQRRRYATFANFGGTEIEVRALLFSGPAAAELGAPEGGIPAKLEDSVALVANVVSEMVRRLRQIRDSALWRVIDAAQAIHRELCEEAALVEVPPWQATGSAEGLLAFFEALDDGAGALDSSACSDAPLSCRDEAAVVDMALIVMRRLEHLGAVAADLRGHLAAPGGDAAAGEPDGADAVLSGVCAAAASLNEELLGLVDEPSAAAVEAWLGLWRGALAGAAGGRSLESAVASRSFRPDSELGGAERRVRRRWMELLRGLQVFLDDPALQAEVAAPLGRLVAPSPPPASGPLLAPASPARTQEGDASMELLSTPPSPNLALSALALPRAGYGYRPPQRRLTGGAPAAGAAGELVLEAPPRPAYIAGWRPDSRPGGSEAAGSEPGSPSQASRFLNGHYAVPRPTSAGMRLPPLEAPPAAAGEAAPRAG